MNKTIFGKFAASMIGCLVLVLAGMVSQGWGTPITLSDSDLQDYFNSQNWGLDAVNDQMGNISAWSMTTASSASNMTFYFEDPDNLEFGIYSVQGGEQATVFYDKNTPIAAAIISLFLPGQAIRVQWLDSNGASLGYNDFSFTGNIFGFYVKKDNNVFYSDNALNDLDGDGIFGELEDTAILTYNVAPGSYIFAVDTDGDGDFYNMVTQAESIAPVPEPATILLFGVGLIGLAGTMRRKIKKQS